MYKNILSFSLVSALSTSAVVGGYYFGSLKFSPAACCGAFLLLFLSGFLQAHAGTGKKVNLNTCLYNSANNAGNALRFVSGDVHNKEF